MTGHVTCRDRSVAATAALVVFLSLLASAAVNHPFGSHPLSYAAGTIKPNHVTVGT
jgi:hypothetical protein